jgi:Leucine-rich repeat (LRR) protein
VNKLDIDWPVNKGLTSLTLKGLLIQDIPAGLGNLKELLELNLDYNPITTLPKEIESLTKSVLYSLANQYLIYSPDNCKEKMLIKPDH